MQVIVRWWDGYVQIFDNVVEWRAGAYLLWVKFGGGHTRHIPLQQVRWFEPVPSDTAYLETRTFPVVGGKAET